MRNLVYKAFQTHPSQAMICESSFYATLSQIPARQC